MQLSYCALPPTSYFPLRLRYFTSKVLLVLAVCAAFFVTACGSSNDSPPAASTPTSSFPKVDGRSLQEMADIASDQVNVLIGASVFTPGKNRFAFGLFDDEQRPIDKDSAVYIARRAKAKALGPFPANSHSLEVAAPFRSQSVVDSDPKSVFSAELPLDVEGGYQILILTPTKGGFNAGITAIPVKSGSEVPAVGSYAPRISTPTAPPGTRDLSAIDTRRPYDDMHSVDFKDVVGKKPVALLFATPQLCSSRLCGPVTDMAAQMQSKYGDRVTFIHNEVYVDNDASKDYRSQLKAFGLKTEPWLFTVDSRGKIAARLEGAFGMAEFEQAVQAAQDQK